MRDRGLTLDKIASAFTVNLFLKRVCFSRAGDATDDRPVPHSLLLGLSFMEVAMAERASGSVFSVLSDFKIREIDFKRPAAARFAATAQTTVPLPAPLGPLTAFNGNWTGQGFNAIFRPNNTTTPTFPPPLSTSDNVLELNLTQESLSFSPNLSSIPNRG